MPDENDSAASDQLRDEPDAEITEVVDTGAADGADVADEASDETVPAATGAVAAAPAITFYGVLSAVLGLVSVVAVVLACLVWFGPWDSHRQHEARLSHQAHVLQAAVGWTTILVNLNAQNVDEGLRQLREKTTGQLNQEFDASVENFRKLAQQIQSRSQGRVESVAIDSLHPVTDDQLGGMARSTDPVMVLAMSVVGNAGGQQKAIQIPLRLLVSDVDGQLLMSGLEWIQ